MAEREYDNLHDEETNANSEHDGGCCGHGGGHGHGNGGCCDGEGGRGHDHGHDSEHGGCSGHGEGHRHGHGGCGHGHGHGGCGHGHGHVPEGRMQIGTQDGFVDRSTHENASIASASMHLAVDSKAAQEVLNNVMLELGRWVENGGGTVGHIKCTVIEQNVTAMSLTADEVQIKTPDAAVGLQFAAIVFGIDPEELQIKVWNLLYPIAA